jgi:uncharacterized protein
MGAAMGAAGIGIAELADLAARRETLDRSFDVSSLTRLGALGEFREGGEGATGPGRLQVRFAFQPGPEGFPQVHVTVTGAVRLRCQRCLKPLHWPVAVDETLTIVGAEEETSRLEDPFATVLLEADALVLPDLVEDEVLASLPLAPKHDERDACPAPAKGGTDDGAAELHRPFAGLASLLAGTGAGRGKLKE